MKLEDIVQKISDGDISAAICFLCKRPSSEYTSAYVPTPPIATRLGQPEGKQRIIIYGVCEQCMEGHGKAEIMELMEASVLKSRGIN